MYTIKKEDGMIKSLKDMLKTTRKSIVNSQKAGEAMTQFDKGHMFCCIQVETALKAILGKTKSIKKKPILHAGNAKAYYNRKYRETPNISGKRVDNIITNYPDIEWDRDTIKITIKGYGDRPAFSIDGMLGKCFPVQFHTNTPGGGASRMYYWVGDKRKLIRQASFIRAEEITTELKVQMNLKISKI